MTYGFIFIEVDPKKNLNQQIKADLVNRYKYPCMN